MNELASIMDSDIVHRGRREGQSFMFRFFSKKPTVPPFSAEIINACQLAIDWSLFQVSAHLLQPARTCPEFGDVHDPRIIAYACGLFTGEVQASGAIERWANGSKGLAEVAHFVNASVIGIGLFGERGAEIVPRTLQQIGQVEDVTVMNEAGGLDGIGLALHDEKPVKLLAYLRNERLSVHAGAQS